MTWFRNISNQTVFQIDLLTLKVPTFLGSFFCTSIPIKKSEIGSKFHTVLFWLDSNSKRPISNSESHRNDDASPSPPMMVKRARPSEEDLVNESQSVPETEITRFEIEIKASRTFPLDSVDQKNIFSLETSVLLNFLTLQFRLQNLSI